MNRDSYRSRLRWVSELPVRPLGSHLNPYISFQEFDDVACIHTHYIRTIVLGKPLSMRIECALRRLAAAALPPPRDVVQAGGHRRTQA